MRELNVRLPSQLPEPSRPRRRRWVDAFLFMVAFLAVFGTSTLLLA
jgi:hypothetical protein